MFGEFTLVWREAAAAELSATPGGCRATRAWRGAGDLLPMSSPGAPWLLGLIPALGQGLAPWGSLDTQPALEL